MPITYYENWILRKEGVNKWMPYWACVRGKWLQFYERESNHERPELRRTLELTTQTTCSLVKRNKYRMPFALNNGSGTYYLKCDTEMERYHWIFSILSAANGKPKSDLPKEIPASMREQEAFRKLTKEEEKKLHPPKSPKEPTAAADIKNKRRRKFAVRQENKTKKKEVKRLRKLGIEPPPELTKTSDAKSNALSEQLKQLQAYENKYLSTNTNQTKTCHQRPQTASSIKSDAGGNNRIRSELRLSTAKQRLSTSKQHSSTSKQPSTSEQQRPSTAKPSVYSNVQAVTALVHPPSSRKTDFYDNKAYEHDVEKLPSIQVILNDDSVLPNMVFAEISDSDTDSEDTEELSLNSQNSLFLLSSNDFTTNIINSPMSTNSRRNSAVKTSHTIISDDDNNTVQQQLEPTTIKKTSTSQTNLRPRNPIEQPISPISARPLSPRVLIKPHTASNV